MLSRLIRLPFELTAREKKQLQNQMFEENIARGMLFARIIIGLEAALTVADVTASISNAHESFHFSFYFVMYMLMIVMNICFLLAARRYDPDKTYSPEQFRRYQGAFLLYSIIFVVWGSIVALADQRLYGQLMAFVVNLMSISVIFYFNNKTILLLYGVSTLVLAAGLPFFQASGEVLVGHYVNLGIFVFFTWIASRILYVTYCRNFYSKVLLGQSNARLEQEIQENLRVHRELERANEELLKLSLVDDLTGIPNRRAFDQQVQSMLSSQDAPDTEVSLIMLDIDYFKQFNDNYGHAEGDKVIKSIAGVIHAASRGPGDIAARLGGEEFVFAAFHTGKEEIAEIAETIREQISGMKITHEFSVTGEFVTGSLGTATGRVRNNGQFAELMKIADEALYAAKAGGRNSVVRMNMPKTRPLSVDGKKTEDWEV
ncbi:GGDEF domain-containing protein [Paenibacillus agri]|uniref:Diguanylate cyclase n=1 Tax=Paenibacillus agri TaxID=2744309 RepID=A0A850ECS3_9BACL|nr:diguanylate cyclase [Paenibacillus agri]NUU59033.1 diguanylate cyclase [Paenibacillus agri]